MKTNKKIIIGLATLAAASCALGLVACSSDNEIDKNIENGYTVSVTYDANGGTFLGRDGNTIMDMFKPANYTADSEGNVQIKLLEPTHENRPSGSSEKISLTMADHFFAGWYQERELLKNEKDEVVDEYGQVLTEKDGSYYYVVDKEDEETGEIKKEYIAALPAYSYSQYWDFENDVIEYNTNSDEVMNITLYAGWVSYYQFDFYFEGDNGQWELDSSYTYDYKTTNALGSTTSDKDTIFLPTWQDGAMNYSHKYSNTTWSFPKKDGTTFYKAYKDAACTQEIVDFIEHEGTLDLETATPTNKVQNVYVKVEEGERYKISEAKQLANNPNVNGIYEILADLDFTNLKWPALLSSGAFKGKMYSTEGNTFTISNVTVEHNSSSSRRVGLFGELTATASVSNLNFVNATLDLKNTGMRLKNVNIGLFAGLIDEKATVENVSISGTIKIGQINLGDGYAFNLYANGNLTGLNTSNPVKLVVYGLKLVDNYSYTVDPTAVVISQDNLVTLTFVTGSNGYFDEQSYNIN